MEILLLIGLAVAIIQGILYLVFGNETSEITPKLPPHINRLARAENSFRKQARTTYSCRGYSAVLENIKKTIGKGGSTTNLIRIVLFTNQVSGSSDKLLKEPGSENQDSVQDIVHHFATLGFGPLSNGQVIVETNGEILRYEQQGSINDRHYIQLLCDKICDLADVYLKLITLGGEAVPQIQALAGQENFVLQGAATRLLQDIAQDTTTRLGHRASNLLCLSCLRRFGPHRVAIALWRPLTYYGCRVCGQGQDFFEGKVILILNEKESTELSRQEGVLEVNWMIRRKMFDFDEAMIVNASDEAVERFAVQIGNDIEQRQIYRKTRCKLSSNCKLSENTLRILRRAFGHLEISN